MKRKVPGPVGRDINNPAAGEYQHRVSAFIYLASESSIT